MPLLWLDPDDGSEVRQLLPDTILPPVAVVLPPGEPEPEPEPERCPPPIMPERCPPPLAEPACVPIAAHLASGCECAWDGGRSQWDGGRTRWECEPEPDEE